MGFGLCITHVHWPALCPFAGRADSLAEGEGSCVLVQMLSHHFAITVTSLCFPKSTTALQFLTKFTRIDNSQYSGDHSGSSWSCFSLMKMMYKVSDSKYKGHLGWKLSSVYWSMGLLRRFQTLQLFSEDFSLWGIGAVSLIRTGRHFTCSDLCKSSGMTSLLRLKLRLCMFTSQPGSDSC